MRYHKGSFQKQLEYSDFTINGDDKNMQNISSVLFESYYILMTMGDPLSSEKNVCFSQWVASI